MCCQLDGAGRSCLEPCLECLRNLAVPVFPDLRQTPAAETSVRQEWLTCPFSLRGRYTAHLLVRAREQKVDGVPR